MEQHAEKISALVPIRVEFETDTHRVRDCFVWNLNEALIKPETFAKTFCADLDLPATPWVDTVTNQIRAQLEEYEGVASMNLGVDGASDVDAMPTRNGEEVPECRVILSVSANLPRNSNFLTHWFHRLMSR
jgi:chromatin structure-remodeling complex subunit SFH1